MITADQAQIIDRLRAAAADHGEVAELLTVLADCLSFKPNGEAVLCKAKAAHLYLATAAVAASFVWLDRQPKEEM